MEKCKITKVFIAGIMFWKTELEGICSRSVQPNGRTKASGSVWLAAPVVALVFPPATSPWMVS